MRAKKKEVEGAESEVLKSMVIIWKDKLSKNNMLHLTYPTCDPPWRPCFELTKLLKKDILESKASVQIESIKRNEYQISIRFRVPSKQ